MTQDALWAVGRRLEKVNLESLSDDQAIAFAQAQAALIGAHAQVATYEYLTSALHERLTQLVLNLDSAYRRKHGQFPEQEQW